MSERTIAPVSQQMSSRIAAELDSIEQAHGVRVLYACESGSRAWGFASENSDYDVRFIYAHEPTWYLQLGQKRDVIEWALDEVLDINGRDLPKALRLLRASNPTVFEWLNSPIVYRVDEAFSKVTDLSRMAPSSLSANSFLNHRRSMSFVLRLVNPVWHNGRVLFPENHLQNLHALF